MQTDYGYDADNRLNLLSNFTVAGQLVHEAVYGRDAVGNITDLTQTSDMTEVITYSYDPTYRLLGADYAGSLDDETFTYDLVGNRKTYDEVARGRGTRAARRAMTNRQDC